MFPLYDLNPHNRFPWFTLLLIAANTLVMVGMTTSSPQEQANVAYEFGFIPKRITQLSHGRAYKAAIPQVDENGEERRGVPPIEKTFPASPGAVYTTLLTTMFLHGGWLHLISNMWMLWIFGNNIEDRL